MHGHVSIRLQRCHFCASPQSRRLPKEILRMKQRAGWSTCRQSLGQQHHRPREHGLTHTRSRLRLQKHSLLPCSPEQAKADPPWPYFYERRRELKICTVVYHSTCRCGPRRVIHGRLYDGRKKRKVSGIAEHSPRRRRRRGGGGKNEKIIIVSVFKKFILLHFQLCPSQRSIESAGRRTTGPKSRAPLMARQESTAL